MEPEVLRQKLMSRIDALLGRPLLVWGEDRKLLTALRSYLGVISVDELKKLSGYMVMGEADDGLPAAE